MFLEVLFPKEPRFILAASATTKKNTIQRNYSS